MGSWRPGSGCRFGPRSPGQQQEQTGHVGHCLPPTCVSPPFTPCELGQESTPRELQPSQSQRLSRRRRGGWTGCWRSWPESGDDVGPPTCLEEAGPRRTASCRRPQPVLAAVWDCGAHLVLGEKEGRRGGPIQAHRPRLNTGTPSGCSAQAHTWLSFSPCPLPGPGGHPPLQQLTCPRAWAGLEQTLCSENPPAWSGPAYSSPISDQCSQHPGLLHIPCPRI